MRPFAASARLRLLASTIGLIGSSAAFAQTAPLPTDGTVTAGSATIDQQGGAMAIRQTSGRAVIDWRAFSIGSGNSVNVLQPGSTSALLNRVTGNDVSTIAGSLTSNGQVILVNRNGILIDQDGRVDAHGGFVASTLDITNDDFLAGKLDFGGGGSGAVVNRGYIAGGAVALLGSRVANLGTIVSPMGKVAIGAAQQATLDLNGDGFLQVAIPSEFGGADGAPLIDQRGLIDVGGGTVVLRAVTAREIVRQTINMSGIVRATSVSRDGGTVVLDGGEGGAVAVSGTIDASGARGGRVDVSGGDVALSGATVAATGSERGGLVRIGGAFQGGAPNSALTATLADAFTNRFGTVAALRSAQTTSIDAASSIDASGTAAGGTVVVWSAERTRQLGTITAKGLLGGAVELSSKGALTTDLGRVTPGRGGSLLLDPKNINVYDPYGFASGNPGDATGGTVGYGDNAGLDSTFNVADLKLLIDGGTDVILRASNDINWNANLGVGFDANPGDLSLSAGRSVNLSGSLTMNQADLIVVANDTAANGVVDADRDPGAGEINAIYANISGGTASGWSGGHVSLAIGTGAGVTNGQAGDMRLSSITARSITIDAGTRTVSLFDHDAGVNTARLTANDAVTLTGAIKVQSGGGLTINGRSVDWVNEAGALLSATSPDTVVRFVENGVLTRYGVLRGGSTGGEGGEGGEGGGALTDTTRLALGKGADGIDYSAIYGDAYGTFDSLHLVSGSMIGTDTLGSILTSGSTTMAGPAAGQSVGDYAVTTAATEGFGLASGVSGYFIDLRQASDTLRITPKALAATVTPGNYTYGSPTNVATLSGLVGNDVVGLAASVAGLGTQALTANGSGYAFAGNMAAGQRDFTLTGLTGTAASNYTIDLSAPLSASLAIARRSLIYAGSTDTSTYGTLNGANFSLSGALAGDDVSVGLAGISSGGVTSALTATTNVGTYATIASSLSGSAAGNYVIDVANSSAGSAIINPKTILYSTSNANSTYGTLAAIGSPTLSGVIAGDDVGAVATLNGGGVTFSARTAAGTYNIDAALTGSGAGNYILSALSGSVGVLRVGKLGLGVTLADAAMVYLDGLPDLATLSGVLSGDDVRTFGTVDGSVDAYRPDVGTHQYMLGGITGASVNNYFLDLPTSRTAILTVTPRPINFTINSLNTTYGTFGTTSLLNLSLLNPSSNPLTASIVATNTLTGVSTALDANTLLGAGTYTLRAGSLSGIGASNFMIATSGNQDGALVVDRKTITYSAESVSGTYGDLPRTPAAVLDGAFSFDAVAPTVSILSGSTPIDLGSRTNAGSYVVTVTGITGAGSGNYILGGGTDGQLTIAQRSLSYLLGLGTATYGQLATPSTRFFGLLDGDSVTPYFTVNGQELTNRLNAGTYQVEIGGLRGPQGGNYVLSALQNTSADLYIQPAPLSYTMAAGTSVYGDYLRFSPLIWSGLQFDDAAPNYTVDVGGREQFATDLNAGTYTPYITANLGLNYFLAASASSAGQYVVTRRPVGLESYADAGAFGTSYGLTPDQITGRVRVTNLVNDDAVPRFTATPQGLTTSTGGYVNVGSYLLGTDATVGQELGLNYTIGSIANGSFTVDPRYLGTAGVNFVNATYGTLTNLVGTTATPFGGDDVNFGGIGVFGSSGQVDYVAQTAAGSYVLRASGLIGADARNYILDSNNEVGTLTIAPRALTFRADSRTATYGTLLDLGTAPLTGIIGTDQVVATNLISGYTDRSNVGVYQFNTPTLSGASASNYTIDVGGSLYGYLSVAARALSVTYLDVAASGDPVSWTYGDLQDPTKFIQVNGILSGDTVDAPGFAVLTGTAAGNPLSIGSTYGLGSLLNAGSYRVSAWDIDGRAGLTGASASNYVLTNGSATNSATTFMVSPRSTIGSLTVPSSIVYGDAPATEVSFSDTVGQAAIDYVVTATAGTTIRGLGRATALPANLAVGTQQLAVTLAGLDAFNYVLGRPVTGQVSITPKTVTIDQLLTSVTYATTTDAVFGINGMVAGDDVAPLLTLNGAAATRATTVAGGFGLGLITTDVGTVATTIGSLTGSAAGNYSFTGYDGSLAITPKTITYTSDGFSAQYGGLTLPVCPSGCEMSGRDNNLAMGAVTLNGILPADINLVGINTYLSLDGVTSAFGYARNTRPGTYLQIAQTLTGSKAGNYVMAAEGNRAGLVFIIPAWIEATVSGGGRLYTSAAAGTYVSLGTPGVVTLQRSSTLTDAQGGRSFLTGDRVNVLTALVDAKGNIVDGTSNLAVGDYTINPLALTGPEAANYRLVPEGPNGSTAGIFTVSDRSVFNFTFLSSFPNGYYSPPALTNPVITPTASTTASATGTTTTTATVGLLSGGAGAGATGSISITQTNADGSSLAAVAGGSVAAEAGYTATGATATVALSGNVSLIITQGPVTINYGAFADASAKVEVSLKDLTIAAGGEVMVGAQEGITVAGNLGSGMSGSTGLQAQVFGTANGETTMSLKNGANLGTSGFIGVGASIGVDGSLSGGGVTGSIGATLYSPGSLYIGAKVESGYEDHTLTLGLNLGISLLIGGVELSPKISFSTEKLEAAGTDFANAWVGLAEMVNGSYCDAACTSARNKITADYEAAKLANTLSSKVDAAAALMIGYQTPTLGMIQYLQANPDVVHFAQEAQSSGTSTSGTTAITSAIANYQYLTDYLGRIVAQETALATRLAADPSSLTAADLALANSLRIQEKNMVLLAGQMFNARVVVVDGQITFG